MEKTDYDKIMMQATGGQESISNDFMPASGGRALIFDDPGMLWLEHHGEEEEGYQKDSGKFRTFPFICGLGGDFEEQFIRREAPDAIRIMKYDWEVRKRESFEKTLEYLRKGAKFLWKAALWWFPEQIYGAADAIVHTSWLYKRYPHLKPSTPEPAHYVIIDFKFSQKLETSPKKAHLSHATSQIRLYSYILGHLQGFMPPRGFIISRDTIDAPITIDVDLVLHQPLDEELTDLRDAYLDIKLRGAKLRPWKDEEVRLNPANKQDEPWHDAKAEILTEKVRPRSLLMLSGVGVETARKMKLHGFQNVDDLLSRDIDRLRFEDVDGISSATAERLRSVLKANKTGEASEVPSNLIPRRADVEIMLDFEYLSSLQPDWDAWPYLSGTPMIFMVGCGYKEAGKWVFRSFTASEHTHSSEEVMLRKVLTFLRQKGVFDPSKTVALYTWSGAEQTQARQAAQRHNLPQLENLPLVDLRKVFMDGQIALPGAFGWGLKEIAEALGDHAPHYKVEWPEGLNSGQAAQIAGFVAYEEAKPLKTSEMRLITDYLEMDCRALERILAWLRNSRRQGKPKKAASAGWYRVAGACSVEVVTLCTMTGGWYRSSVAGR